MKDNFMDRQRALLRAGRLSRRDFINSAMTAGIVLPTAMTLADGAMAQSAKRGGDLKIGLGHGSTTDSLDPGTYENGFSTNVGYMWGNSLTEVAPNGELVGDLVTGWEASPDAMTWRMPLREGVTFHNGKTMTPDDVIASLNFHRGEDSKSAAKGLFATVDDISADGNTLVFQLNTGNADFPFLMSDYHLLIMPSEGGSVDPNAGIGTGPYVLEAFEPGVRCFGRRNENYHKSDAAWFDTVEVLSIIDPTARQNALMNGTVHFIDRVDPKTASLLGRAPNVTILEKTGFLHYTMPMRVTSAPFDNYDLRMALKYSIKRQELVDKILLGHGVIGNDHPISPSVPFHAAGLEQREFDADKARFHFEKSGHSGPIQLSTSDAAFAGAVDAAQLVAASAAEAGIEIEVVREPSDGYWSNVWNKKGWCTCYWGGRPTQDWMYSSAYTADTEWNDTDWRTTDAAVRFNEVVGQARAELDNAKRADMYFEAQSLINDDGGAIVPMFANYIMGHSNMLAHNDDVAANWELDGYKLTQRWWFA
ncbi:ABC transporter substrate-binding protein [Loktanella sp. IMCC34160]|uniref:ABC transporter substrate-binding protein n=1 Tax=Loktanella sp. IMCC34160 TaxID=2510646 RepID=UPI00101D5746|nr:ABC transporter substrate-binding protein [Loktanella sp. IMCC34160]RYG89799.1 ABC transporter substrate-binding protein [Loktanella sp. IMCC34160]